MYLSGRAKTNQGRKLLIKRRFWPWKLFKGGNYSWTGNYSRTGKYSRMGNYSRKYSSCLEFAKEETKVSDYKWWKNLLFGLHFHTLLSTTVPGCSFLTLATTSAMIKFFWFLLALCIIDDFVCCLWFKVFLNGKTLVIILWDKILQAQVTIIGKTSKIRFYKKKRSLQDMAILVVEFSRKGYKIRKVFGYKLTVVKWNHWFLQISVGRWKCQNLTFKNHPNLSDFFFIEKYKFRSTFFVIDIFW